MSRVKLSDEERKARKKVYWERITNPPKMDHAGSPGEWAAQARAILTGKLNPTEESLSVLGFNEVPSESELKSRYREMQKKTHPDMGGTVEKSAAVNEAYETLLTVVKPDPVPGAIDGTNIMLAKSGDTNDIEEYVNDPSWVFEEKLDGVRCVVVLKDGNVYLLGRGKDKGKNSDLFIDTTEGRMRSYGPQFPEIVRSLLQLAENHKELTILDGELVCINGGGLVSFPLMQTRMNRTEDIEQAAEEHPATFVAFDILFSDGKDIRQISLSTRRLELNRILSDVINIGPIRITLNPQTRTVNEKRALWVRMNVIKAEGVMAKQVDSNYYGTRRPEWIKMKRTETYDVIVVGWEEGTGKLAGDKVNIHGHEIGIGEQVFGALQCAVYDNGELVDVGKCGGGFSHEDRREITRRYCLPGGKINSELVIEVVAFGLAKEDGRMRMPQFWRIRKDKSSTECTVEQFKGE